MSRSVRAVLLWVLCWVLPAAGWAAEAPLVLDQTTPLTGVSGRIDHMAIDLGRKRLMVAELGNGTVDVIDLAAGKTVPRLTGLRDPQGVGYLPATDLIAVASAGDGSVRFFRAGDFVPSGVVDLGDDADNIRIDSGSGQLIVGYGSGGLAVIDPVSRLVVSRTKLPAHPEGFQLAPSTGLAFVNLPAARQMAVVDLAAAKQINTLFFTDWRANFPMAFNGRILANVFRSPARLLLENSDRIEVEASLRTCGDADDVFFDARRDRVYVSCGEGAVDVVQKAPTGYGSLGLIKTASGARTSLFVPELDRLYVAARAGFPGLGRDAAILVFQPRP